MEVSPSRGFIPGLITLAVIPGLKDTPEESGPGQGFPGQPRESEQTRESENNVVTPLEDFRVPQASCCQASPCPGFPALKNLLFPAFFPLW